MNLNRIIKNLHGEESAMSFPSQEVLSSAKRGPDGKIDMNSVPRETVKNVVINCLAQYIVKDRKEMFYVNTTAQAVLGAEGDTFELKDKFQKFLIEVLYSAIVQEKDGQQSGVYYSWVVGQVLEELGVSEE